MNGSEHLEKLIPALIAAKVKFKPVLKKSQNPFFKSQYANLEMVIDATEPALLENGLVCVQTPDGDGLVTTLYHTSGQWISGTQALHPAKQDPQGWHSAQTYARRYGIMGILCLAAEDDDGNEASKNDPHHSEKQDQVFVERSGIKKLTEDQLTVLEDFRGSGILVVKASKPWEIDAPKWLKLCGCSKLADLSEVQAHKLILECEKKLSFRVEE